MNEPRHCIRAIDFFAETPILLILPMTKSMANHRKCQTGPRNSCKSVENSNSELPASMISTLQLPATARQWGSADFHRLRHQNIFAKCKAPQSQLAASQSLEGGTNFGIYILSHAHSLKCSLNTLAVHSKTRPRAVRRSLCGLCSGWRTGMRDDNRLSPNKHSLIQRFIMFFQSVSAFQTLLHWNDPMFRV